MRCRHCGVPLKHIFLDLGFAPPSNAYLTEADLGRPETYYPLRIFVCDGCWLVQTEDFAKAEELFRSDYAYFSGTSSSWLKHAEEYARMITARLGLNKFSYVIEVASNDGYLLKNFVAAGVPCLGIEPTESTAAVAEKSGIPVLKKFFGETLGKELARQGRQADLIIGNNVYAHVPDINDFTRGLKAALKPSGVITLEFPHLMRMIELSQFDTIYHEHFSYLSLSVVNTIFESAELRIWDVEELRTHGGSLRIYGCHVDDPRQTTCAVRNILQNESDKALQSLTPYLEFQNRVDQIKNSLLEFLLKQKRTGKSVAAYGAAAKGNTLLNYAGVKPDLLPYSCDAAVAKQGKFMPGSHIPILPPAALEKRKPDYVLILPWNIAEEVVSQQNSIREWGGKFVVAIPSLLVSD